MPFVIDASIAAAFAFGETGASVAAAAIEHLERTHALAPLLFFYEVRNTLIVGERRGRSDPLRTAAFLADLAQLPIQVIPPSSDDHALMALARTHNLTLYDAAYLDLAMRESLPLATLDRALERAARVEGVPLFGN